MKYTLMAPCHFGMEAVLKKELLQLGLNITEVMDGRVIFEGDEGAIARANVFLRTAERVLLIAGDFTASARCCGAKKVCYNFPKTVVFF